MRSLIVAFEFGNDATVEHYNVLYSRLAGLGFSVAIQGTFLPRNILVGHWFDELEMQQIRSLLWQHLVSAGVPLTRLIVADYSQLAYIGPRVPMPPGLPPGGDE